MLATKNCMFSLLAQPRTDLPKLGEITQPANDAPAPLPPRGGGQSNNPAFHCLSVELDEADPLRRTQTPVGRKLGAQDRCFATRTDNLVVSVRRQLLRCRADAVGIPGGATRVSPAGHARQADRER